MKKLLRKFHYGEKGFTLIELLVVVAILGVLAAVAVPNVGKFINRGKDEAKETELHNIQTAVMAMMADSINGTLDVDGTPDITDIQNVGVVQTSDSGNNTKLLRDYLTGLDGDNAKAALQQDFGYTFGNDGTVTLVEH